MTSRRSRREDDKDDKDEEEVAAEETAAPAPTEEVPAANESGGYVISDNPDEGWRLKNPPVPPETSTDTPPVEVPPETPTDVIDNTLPEPEAPAP